MLLIAKNIRDFKSKQKRPNFIAKITYFNFGEAFSRLIVPDSR